jgi:RNA polymerase sigma-70 factor (ECF subfamily)
MDGGMQGHRRGVEVAMLDGMPVDAATPASAPQAGAAGAQTLESFLDDIAARAYRFAESGLRHREDAMDVVQDAMVKMLGYRARPADEWTPLFWTILRSRIVDAQRRRTLRLGWMTSADERQEAGVEWADAGPDPSRAHDGKEAWGELVAALRDLPRRQREAFGLRVLEELDVATTARVMGCSEGSVKTHLSRARDALQKRLEDFR